jgi:hypothetical protein
MERWSRWSSTSYDLYQQCMDRGSLRNFDAFRNMDRTK